jgi:hypothetical protein
VIDAEYEEYKKSWEWAKNLSVRAANTLSNNLPEEIRSGGDAAIIEWVKQQALSGKMRHWRNMGRVTYSEICKAFGVDDKFGVKPRCPTCGQVVPAHRPPYSVNPKKAKDIVDSLLGS